MSSEHNAWQTWQDALGRDDIARELREALDAIDVAVAGSGFACQQSGRCCKFESFGHRLYMTGLEIAYFRQLAGAPPAHDEAGVTLPILDARRDGCPYQVNGMCSVHEHRPFACRVFFCQEGSDDWQTKQYEAFQAKVRQLHDKHGLPYRYMEWRQGLADAHLNGA